MILKIIHPTRGDIGTVELKNGIVAKTTSAHAKSNENHLRQMKHWIEASVREYAKNMNWIVTEERENVPK